MARNLLKAAARRANSPANAPPIVVRLRLGLWPIVQTALAASVAWVLAVLVVGYGHSSFAPVAAVLSLGVSIGQRERRAMEAILGTSVGLALAVLLVSVIGSGPAQLLVMVVLGMLVGVLFGGGPLLQNQAAIIAISVALQFGSTPPIFGTLSSMLMGCGVALVVNYLLPINPEARVNRAARAVVSELAGALDETAEALADGDLERTERALQRARGVDELVRGLREEVAVGRWTARHAPPRRRALGHLELYAVGVSQIEVAVLNVRGVVRAALNLIERAMVPPRPLVEATHELARAMEALGRYLEASEGPEDARRFAVKAAGVATALLRERNDLATSEFISMIRSAAVDVLRATGMERAAALRRSRRPQATYENVPRGSPTTLLPRPPCRLTIKALVNTYPREEVVPMEDSMTTGFHSIRCPFCEVYDLERSGEGSARCTSCGGSLDAELLATLWEIQTLPDALGSHPCEECGHPQMRRLPDEVFHCPACGSEVLPAGGSAESCASAGASEAYLCGWVDGFFGSAANFLHNRELIRWEDATDRLDYYRGHRAGREAFLGSELREAEAT